MKQGKVRPLGLSPAISQGDEICCSTSGPQCLPLSIPWLPQHYIPSLSSYPYLQWFPLLLFLWMLLRSLHTFIPVSRLHHTLPGFLPHLQSSSENPRPSSISQHLPNQSYLHFNARSLSQYSISLLVLQSVSKLLVIFHKGKSTNTSGESTMRKPTTYKNIVKCNDEETSDHFPQESLGNISERYTWKNELTLQQSG